MEMEGEDYIPFPHNDIHRRLDGCLGPEVYWKPTHSNLYLKPSFYLHPSKKQIVLSTMVHRGRGLVC
jgi:hypothetical protein